MVLIRLLEEKVLRGGEGKNQTFSPFFVQHFLPTTTTVAGREGEEGVRGEEGGNRMVAHAHKQTLLTVWPNTCY